MAALALLEDVANCALRRERIFMDREDLLHNPDQWLMSRYRLQLQPWLQRRTARLPHIVEYFAMGNVGNCPGRNRFGGARAPW
ncbi:uncharacterized protein V6R79_003261 [Siganus canaliculatus]